MVTLRLLSLASIYQLAATAVAWLGSLWLWRPGSLAVLVGGLLMAGNFWALRFFAARALDASKPKMAYAILLAFKFVIILGLLALCVLVLRLDPIGIAVGLATLLVGIGAATAHAAFSTRSVPPGS